MKGLAGMEGQRWEEEGGWQRLKDEEKMVVNMTRVLCLCIKL